MVYIVLYVCLCCLFGYQTRKFTSKRGHDSVGYFWLGFFLGFIGVIIAAFLTAQKTPATPMHAGSRRSYLEPIRRSSPEPSDDNRQEHATTQWVCAHCWRMNDEHLTYCTRCGRDKKEYTGKTLCPSCGVANDKERDTCRVCNMELHEPTVEVEHTVVGVPDIPVNPTLFISDEIVKLKQLADQGIITNEEFDFKKKQLLGYK